MVIAGDFNRDSALTWVNRYFGGIPRGPQMPARPWYPTFAMPRDTFLLLEDKVTLPRLYETGTPRKFLHPDDAALDVLADMLAGDKNSRLYKRLVFDMQVAQDVTAFQQQRASSTAIFQISVTSKPGQTPAHMAELVHGGDRQDRRKGSRRASSPASLNSRRAAIPRPGFSARQVRSPQRIQLHRRHARLRAAGRCAIRRVTARRRAARRGAQVSHQTEGGAHRGSRKEEAACMVTEVPK